VRARILVGAAVLGALLAAVIGWRSCRDGTRNTSGSTAGSASHGTGDRATKKAAHDGPVEPASLAGRVTRTDSGAGIAGATVSLAPAELMAMFIESNSPTLVAVTDASGAWSVARVPPGAYVVAATAPGYMPGSHEKLVVGSGEQKRGVDLALTAGGTIISGLVSDVGGGPIADARITATKGGNMPELWGRADLVTTTGADGRYAITLADGDYQIKATHDEYTTDHESAELKGVPLTVDFTLVPGAVIRGQVVARDTGAPVPGALVRGDSSGRGEDGTTITDGSGAFTLRSLSAGTVELSAMGRGYASATPTVVAVGIGEQVEGARVFVDRAYSISGRVVKKSKPAEGLPGVTLGAFSIAAKAFGLALEPSADDGAFEIVGLRPASYIVGAIGEGTVPEIGKNVEVVDKDVEGLVIEMSAGVTVSGRVEPAMTASNISIAPAGQIGLANMFEAAKAFLVHGQTDAAGAFTLKNVPAGAFKLHARAPDGHSGELPLLVAETDLTGLVVKLESRASVSGRVVDTNGKPVAGSEVSAERLDGDHDNVVFSIGERKGRGRTSANTDGTFTIVGLEPGKWRVRASSGEDYDWTEQKKDAASKAAVELELTATTVKTGVTLTVEARDGVIRGTVVMPDRKPAADAWVTAHKVIDKPQGLPDGYEGKWEDWGPTSPPVLTGADGQFTIARLRRGTYKLVVEGPRGATRGEKKGVKTGDTVTIELASLGTLTGKVTALGKPVTKYEISCDGPGHDAEKLVEAADGAYTLERLAPGSFACTVTSDAGTGSGKVDVPAGAATLDIVLTPWASITGVVVSVLDKKPVVGVHAFAGSGTGADMFAERNLSEVMSGRAPKTDAAGHFVIERVAEGKGKVAIMPADGFTPLGARDYTATAGQRVDVGTIEVVPPRTGDAGTFGFATNIDGDKLLVSSVKEDGPAAAAGVQVGDRIVAISGQDVATLKLPIAQTLLASGTVGVGQVVQLSLERGGAKVAATVTSVKW
jgi:protocatechuate 3,4-dioxygenase beta subunit